MGSSWALPAEDPVYEDPLDFDFWDNCRTRGMPSSMMPYRYNGGFQILQAPGVVVFNLEMIHDARIIYTDGRAGASDRRSRSTWASRAATGKATRSSSRRRTTRKGRRSSTLPFPGHRRATASPSAIEMKTTERITRLNNDMWLYEVKTEDPVVLTRPFTVRYPMRNDPSYEWWEYACHEGNTIIQNYGRRRTSTSVRTRRSNRPSALPS